jgi:hypothetical protein
MGIGAVRTYCESYNPVNHNFECANVGMVCGLVDTRSGPPEKYRKYVNKWHKLSEIW